MQTIVQILAGELNKSEEHVKNVVDLLDEGNTVPFIARYRKEMHGTMDDQTIRTLADRLTYLRNLEARRQEVRNSIENQGKLTDELAAAIDAAATLAEVEDLYRPYKQKRRTRATVAREKGLESLAALLYAQEPDCPDPLEAAAGYADPEKGVETAEDALQGANDIIAEDISDDAAVRKTLREFMLRQSVLETSAAKDEDSVYRLYYEFQRPVAKLQGHQILAVNRGEREAFLKVSVVTDRDAALVLLRRAVVRPGSKAMDFMKAAVEDAYDRLLYPSLEREIRNHLTEEAGEGAIHNFALNLRPLLMQPPVKGKTVLAIDPAYRTGCKIAVVDPTGKVLDTAVVYPTPPQNKVAEAKQKLGALIRKHHVDVLSIGNGTASKESELFAAELIREMDCGLSYMMVNEAGASVYSASKLGAQEFPDFDVSLRSAVSIARRLQDPLAELVKIDPKSVGVGQYQHDMNQKRLSEALGGVVEDSVNKVGVDLNTASAPLLEYVSGITKTLAKNIVAYREANGRFADRRQLLKVPKLGPKAYEQCAGFLRIAGGTNPLDATSVHPESYEAATKLLTSLGYSAEDIQSGGLKGISRKVGKPKQMAQELGVGELTLQDIIAELEKPARDPRDEMPRPVLRSDVLDMKDLTPGMVLKGTVRNIIDFGAFVDIGVHQDGLVHISQMCDRYIKHPLEVVKIGDIVEVKVISVDPVKKRIALTMKL